MSQLSSASLPALSSPADCGADASGATDSTARLQACIDRAYARSVPRVPVLLPGVQVGRHARITRAVVDRDCVIPDGLVIGEDPVLDGARFHRSPNGICLVTADMLAKMTRPALCAMAGKARHNLESAIRSLLERNAELANAVIAEASGLDAVLAKLGTTLGSGAIMVYDEDTDPLLIAWRLAKFYAHESCGKCTPCRIGSTRGVETIDRIANAQDKEQQVHLLRDLCDTMLHGSLCAMGGMTPYPVLSALNHYPADFGLPAKADAVH